MTIHRVDDPDWVEKTLEEIEHWSPYEEDYLEHEPPAAYPGDFI